MRPHSYKVRAKAIRLYSEQGKSIAEISSELSISYNSISTWVKRYKKEGDKGLIPTYSITGRPATYDEEIFSRAIEYKKAHPKWGAQFIILKLEDDFPNRPLPKARRLQQIFSEKNLQPKKDKLPKGNGKWATKAFDRVQVDAKERLRTADQQPCCYLTFTDEFTGAVLEAFVFSLSSNQRSTLASCGEMCSKSFGKMGANKMFSF